MTVAVCPMLPLVPVMVSMLVAALPPRGVWIVSVELVLVACGLKAAVAPEGSPLTLSATAPANPPLGVTVTV